MLSSYDGEVYELIEAELKRQSEGIELIASENFASPQLIACMGNIMTNKYAEGRPGKRYYGGCSEVDKLENLAIERVCKLFSANFANVQPHSGAQANAAVLLALAEKGDRILGMDLSHGGHLTHGSKVNFSGRLYESHFYGLNPETGMLDMDQVLAKAKEVKPKVLIAGASAYARTIDFKKFREIADEVGAYLLVDMAHIAGLVAANCHPSPIPHAHVVTSTTHKTLRGPRGGIILWNDESLSAALNKGVFPGTQGGPLEHVIAAKAVCFKEAMAEEFVNYQKQVISNTKSLAESLLGSGFKLVSNGSDNHLVLIDLSDTDISGKQLEEGLEKVEITLNKNTVPNEPRSPFVTSGVRIGTPAVTSRGMKESEMKQIASLIKEVFSAIDQSQEEKLEGIKTRVMKLASAFPLYPEWLSS
ncbi:MAG: serine hydroxymethyltransferase [Oligoflexales bacterium]|nr:serine hydroxymethyltransferase [Oligoflexales bacterium]